VTNTALHGLRCHPLICMLLKLRLKVDSTPTRFRHFSITCRHTCCSPEFDPFPRSHFGELQASMLTTERWVLSRVRVAADDRAGIVDAVHNGGKATKARGRTFFQATD